MDGSDTKALAPDVQLGEEIRECGRKGPGGLVCNQLSGVVRRCAGVKTVQLHKPGQITRLPGYIHVHCLNQLFSGLGVEVPASSKI